MVSDSYRLLPGALENIATVIARSRLRVLAPKPSVQRSVDRQERYYMVPVEYRGRRAWFKAGLRAAPGLSQALQKERTIQRAFAAYDRRYRLSFKSPTYLSSGQRGDWVWLLRRYWSGVFSGDMTAAFGFTRNFYRRFAPARFARVVHQVGQMTGFMRRRLRLPTHDLGWYLLDFRYYRRWLYRPLLKHPLNPGWKPDDIRRFERHFVLARRFFKRQAKTFTHGDLYPNNIIMVKHGGRQVAALFDWELSHLNLPTFDAVMIDLLAWPSPSWRSKYRAAWQRRSGRTADGLRAWNLARLSLATRLLGFAFLRLTNGQPERYPPLPKKYRPAISRMFLTMVEEVRAADYYLTAHP